VIVDIILTLLLIGAIFRGREAGLVRQACSAVGFIGGLFLGAALQPHLVNNADTTMSRAMLSIAITMGSALLCLSIGEFLGATLKQRLHGLLHINKIDAALGGVAGGLTLIIGVWLVAPAVSSYPSPGLQRAMSQSSFVSTITRSLPSAPQFIARIGNLVNPNGFPDVFAGLEPRPSQSDAPLPSLGDLQPAVEKARYSVVKLEGRGCGGIVEGSGFVAADGYIITNAHVIAGVARPTVIDNNGRHGATAVWFDLNLDVAVLKVKDLVGPPLKTNSAVVANGTPGVVLGYPGGGDFTADPANVLDEFVATGRNIYGNNTTRRHVYELKATIIPGNSGGPVINKNGEVIGLVFAQSTAYKQVGYALTIKQVMDDFKQAVAQNRPVSTSSCAE